ncbi:MAG: hypothetical protein OXE93_01450 [bacterium]|nr:hypothetical protein [bacterium]
MAGGLNKHEHMNRQRLATLALLVILSTTVVACGSESTSVAPPTRITSTAAPVPAPTLNLTPTSAPPLPASSSTFAYPVFQPTGNRLAPGSGLATGFIEEITTKDIELGGTPTWITGASTPEGDVWVVALDDGSTKSYLIPIGAQPIPLDIQSAYLKPDQPPVLAITGNTVSLATTPANASPNSVPVHLAGQRTAYIDNLQRLTVLEPDGSLWQPDVKVLPDSRLVQLNDNQILALADPSSRHPYSTLGDELEATTVVVLTVGVNEVSTIYNSDEAVIESIAPLLADVDGDQTTDVALTISNDTHTWSVVVSTSGQGVLAQSEPTDRLLGWRQIIAVGPLGPNNETQLAEVLHPDGQGSLLFMQQQDNQLRVAASLEGYRSHEFGSRNLEQAVAADIDRDGHTEVILPTLDRQNIAGVRHSPQGAVEVWRRSMGGTLATNIAVLQRPDGTLSLAAANKQGSLRIWQ